KEIIKESLKRIEPFRTALELKEFTIQELKDTLEKKGIQVYNSPEGVYDLQITLVEWGVYSGLLKKEGDKFIAITT
ncbi:MAG: AAA-associated domain-containing protein, partial [Sulfolobaceae archaeon]